MTYGFPECSLIWCQILFVCGGPLLAWEQCHRNLCLATFDPLDLLSLPWLIQPIHPFKYLKTANIFLSSPKPFSPNSGYPVSSDAISFLILYLVILINGAKVLLAFLVAQSLVKLILSWHSSFWNPSLKWSFKNVLFNGILLSQWSYLPVKPYDTIMFWGK